MRKRRARTLNDAMAKTMTAVTADAATAALLRTSLTLAARRRRVAHRRTARLTPAPAGMAARRRISRRMESATALTLVRSKSSRDGRSTLTGWGQPGLGGCRANPLCQRPWQRSRPPCRRTQQSRAMSSRHGSAQTCGSAQPPSSGRGRAAPQAAQPGIQVCPCRGLFNTGPTRGPGL